MPILIAAVLLWYAFNAAACYAILALTGAAFEPASYITHRPTEAPMPPWIEKYRRLRVR